MATPQKLPPNLQKLYDDGQELFEKIQRFLKDRPLDKSSKFTAEDKSDIRTEGTINELLVETRQWFNTLAMEVLPYTVYDKKYLVDTLFGVEQVIRLDEENPEISRKNLKRRIDRSLSLITALPSSLIAKQPALQHQQTAYTSNTAFIIMSMDPGNPELEDVNQAIKEVCLKFGIKAFRADDVEHSDKITDVILQYITNSEFLIADLSYQRPNVYYEIGYAHAINKRPILYRKQKTPLHFDLAVHNVPEYGNVTQLKKLLTKRFEALLGRKAG